jgi:iron(III) transport system substrate-binding protein
MALQVKAHGWQKAHGWLSVGLRLLSILPLLLFALLSTGCGSTAPRVVVYCAQDRDFAEGLFATFTQRTGLAIAPHYDTEATKSVSLYHELVTEAGRPRCDVFWNNEILGTIRLQRQGLLEPYDSPSAAPYPASAKAADHSWHAFAARARVLIVNTKLVKEADRPKSLLDLEKPEWKGKAAMAKPLFGTTATQAACLFEVLGSDRARSYYHNLHRNEIQIVSGNKQVAEGVGAGQYALGVTDTDDAMEEVEAGHPVAILFPDRDGSFGRMGTLFLPNTVALIRRAPHPAWGRQLIDDLLSPASERRLAQDSNSHQFPLNPQVRVTLPPALAPGLTAKRMAVDFEKAADLWEEAEKFLTDEFGS